MLQYLQMKKVTVNLVSESVFTVQGHGVHTAFIEMENLLAKQPSINLLVNQRHARGVDITHFHTFGFFALRRLLSRHVGKIASRYDTTKTERQLLDLYRSLLDDNSEAAGV